MKSRVIIVSLFVTILLACAGKAERCWVCQREIHPAVRAVLTLPDGERVTACCPRCALRYETESGKRAVEIAVTDHGGGGMLPLGRAFLVEGSDETPCTHHAPMADASGGPMQICYDRCMPSLIAFHDEAAAHAFVAIHGGTVFAPGKFPDLPAGGREPQTPYRLLRLSSGNPGLRFWSREGRVSPKSINAPQARAGGGQRVNTSCGKVLR